jgi:cytoskeletal protein CcmA (bactofilin family)
MFRKSSSKSAAPERPRRSGGIVSVIGGDAVITGDIGAADGLRVDGRIEGNVRCGALEQGPSGTIVGDILAAEARLAGLVDGTVDVRILVLEGSSRITGDVTYETLTIASGARVEGRFSHRAEAAAPPKAASGGGGTPRSDLPEELFAQAAE